MPGIRLGCTLFSQDGLSKDEREPSHGVQLGSIPASVCVPAGNSFAKQRGKQSVSPRYLTSVVESRLFGEAFAYSCQAEVSVHIFAEPP